MPKMHLRMQLLPDWSIEGRALYVVYPEQREVSRKLRVLLDHLAETFRER